MEQNITLYVYRRLDNRMLNSPDDSELALELHRRRQHALHDLLDDQVFFQVYDWGDTDDTNPHELVTIILTAITSAVVKGVAEKTIERFTEYLAKKTLDEGVSVGIKWLASKLVHEQKQHKVLDCRIESAGLTILIDPAKMANPVEIQVQTRTNNPLTHNIQTNTMSAKQTILTNLHDNGDNSFKSYLEENVFGIDRRCDLSFPASCWDSARAAGNTFTDVLNNTQDKTFDCLNYLTVEMDALDPVNHLIYINFVEFSGLWRPADPYPPHVEGRAMDFTKWTLSIGDVINFQNIDGTVPEPGSLPTIRAALFPGHVTQYLSPWWISSINKDGSTTDRANDRTSAIDVAHLNHLHLTIPK